MKKPIFFALALHFLLATLLIFRIPLGASPDEGAHFDVIQYIAQNGRWPVFAGQAPPNFGYEFHQPPLYYTLCAPFWAVLPEGDAEKYLARFVSLLFGLGTIFLLYRAAQTVFSGRKIALLAAFFAALSPLQLGMSAGANNDGLAGFFCAWLFLLMARAWENGPDKKIVWSVGVLAALGLWTKNTSLTVSFVAVCSLFFAARKHGFPRAWAPLGSAILIALVVALPLLLRNQFLYGDPLGFRAFSEAATKGTPGFPYFSTLGLDFLTYARGMAWMIFLTIWGFFGGSDTASKVTFPLNPGGPIVRDFYLLPLMLLAIGFSLAPVFGWRRLTQLGEKWSGVWRFWGFATGLVFLAWCNFAFNHFSGGQARYLHPAFVPFCLLFTAGFAAIFNRQTKIAAFIFAVFLLVLTGLNLFVWRTLV